MKKTKYLLLILIIFCLFSKISWASSSPSTFQNNRIISYTDIGHGIPIILIHAFPTDQRLWKPQRALAQHFRIIVLDLWGFGQSSPTNGQAITMTEDADEINQLMKQLNIQKAVIGGESMGGYVSLAFLKKYPDKVIGLILSNTQAKADNTETKKDREELAIEVVDHGTEGLIKNFITQALSPDASVKTKKFLQNILEKQQPTALASALRGMALREDTSNLLANSKLPILIITSDQDKIISPEESQNMHKLAKNSQLVIIKNAGHLSNLEKAQQWNKAVIDVFG